MAGEVENVPRSILETFLTSKATAFRMRIKFLHASVCVVGVVAAAAVLSLLHYNMIDFAF